MTDFDHWAFINARSAAGDHLARFLEDRRTVVIHHPADCWVPRCKVRAACVTYAPETPHEHPIVVSVGADGVLRQSRPEWADVAAAEGII